MKPRLLLPLVLLAVCFSAGCLEFRRQTLSWRHDPASDTLYLFQDFQGIFGGDNPTLLTEEETRQMASVMQGGRTFFFNNWLTEFDRNRLRQTLQTPKGEVDPNPAYEAAIRALAETALTNVTVDNAGFYLNADMELSGAQRVTVRNVSEVMAALNKMLLFLARAEAGKEETSEDEKRLLLKFAESGQDTFRLDDNRLEARWPVTEEAYRKFKDQESPAARTFRKAGGSVDYSDGVLILGLGAKDARMVSVTLPVSEKAYSRNGLSEARRYGVRETFAALEEARAFLQTP